MSDSPRPEPTLGTCERRHNFPPHRGHHPEAIDCWAWRPVSVPSTREPEGPTVTEHHALCMDVARTHEGNCPLPEYYQPEGPSRPTDATESVALPREPATPTPSVEDEGRDWCFHSHREPGCYSCVVGAMHRQERHIERLREMIVNLDGSSVLLDHDEHWFGSNAQPLPSTREPEGV